MPDLDLAELRALTAAALPAPWTLTRGHDGWDLGAGPHGIVTTGAGMRAQDAALIAAARNALPALLDRDRPVAGRADQDHEWPAVLGMRRMGTYVRRDHTWLPSGGRGRRARSG